MQYPGPNTNTVLFWLRCDAESFNLARQACRKSQSAAHTNRQITIYLNFGLNTLERKVNHLLTGFILTHSYNFKQPKLLLAYEQ